MRPIDADGMTVKNMIMRNLVWVYTKPPHDKTNKVIITPSKDSDQPGHPPSLIRDFAVHSIGS